MQKTLAIIGIILLFVLGAIGGWWLRGLRTQPVEPIVQIDTLVLHDTLRVEKPIPRYVRVIDTMLVPVVDTICMRDSVFIPIPREEKIYQDSTYSAVVSGYRPSLDTIAVFQTTKFITITKEKPTKRWNIGPQVGIGFVGNKENALRFGYYAGIGVQYSIFSF